MTGQLTLSLDPPALVVHYGPQHTEGLPRFRRSSLCGVVFRVGGDIAEPPEPSGSSRLEYVTCAECLQKVHGS